MELDNKYQIQYTADNNIFSFRLNKQLLEEDIPINITIKNLKLNNNSNDFCLISQDKILNNQFHRK